MSIKKIFSLLYSLYLFLLSLEFLFFYNTLPTVELVNLLKIQLVSIYVLIFYFSIKIFSFKLVSIYNLFLLSFGIFILSRVFLDIFGLYDFSEITFMIQSKLTLKNQIDLLLYLILSLSIIHLGVVTATIFKLSSNAIILRPDKYLEKIGIRLFVIGLPGAIAKHVMTLYFVLSQGYLALYTDKEVALDFPIWISILSFIFLIGLIFTLASLPKRKTVITVLAVFMFIALLKLFSGARGVFITSLFFVLWYYYQFYSSKNIKFTYMALVAFGLVFTSIFIGFYRVGQDFSIDAISDAIVLFFSSMGGSVLILGLMLRYEDLFVNHGLPYILNPFITLFAPSSQGLDRLQSVPSLAEHLTYFLAPDRYLAGEGIGTSFLGELFDLGIIGFIIGNFILGFFIIYFSQIAKSNRIALILSYHIVTGIIWMPRGGYFPSVIVIMTVLLSYLLFTALRQYNK